MPEKHPTSEHPCNQTCYERRDNCSILTCKKLKVYQAEVTGYAQSQPNRTPTITAKAVARNLVRKGYI